MKASAIHQLERIYRRKISPQSIISPELARLLSQLSYEIGRQIGILINRRGDIEYVVVGDSKSIMLPKLGRTREGKKRFRGLRLVHTHLKKEPINNDDLTDLALLRLDLVATIEVGKDGLPEILRGVHLLPAAKNGSNWNFLEPAHPANIDINFRDLITSLEEEFSRNSSAVETKERKEKAILISVTTERISEAEYSMAELTELAISCGVEVVDRIIQKVHSYNPAYLLGKGRLSELVVKCMQLEADLLIFDRNLSPAQANAIADYIDIKVIDRTQLILDIFAQHAHSMEGKLQVELAQLKYTLPRLVGKGTEMSRLMGGIGGRGPGETKLEIDRRKVRKRIQFLESKIKKLSQGRSVRRAKRNKSNIPIISIIGYTNAGKSTLLNNLTASNLTAESKMFATLDPASRRLRFPKEREVIITDTVGFIKDLPKDLLNAFRTTLEELEDADLLLHIVDISSPSFERQIKSVNEILKELNLNNKPTLLVFNKIDLLDEEVVKNILSSYKDAIAICAKKRETFGKLIEKIEEFFWIDDKDKFKNSNALILS
ncbi:MAG: GTPase HflX [Candidatus Schekmanbacteria bacterium]|nr:MAG: GTPase HflX [Candidatus Schekmanbacteria bacterium]